MTKKCMCSSLLLILFLFPFRVYAIEDKSDLQVEIIKSPISLKEIIVPTFEKIQVKGSSQKVKATGDLIIVIRDDRVERESPWLIYYSLSGFSNQLNPRVEVKDIVLHLGKGNLILDDQSMSKDNLNAQAETIQADVNKLILQGDFLQPKIIKYQISKENIYLEVPKNINKGTYTATQMVTLINAPSTK